MKLDINKVRQFGNLEFLAKQLVEGFITGLHKSPYHGFSVEFAEHRLYNYGESTRHIDWKVFARTDKLFTKRYEEETNLRCLLVIDNSSSMYYPVTNKGKLYFSVLSAAAIAYLLHKQRDAVGLCTFSSEIETQTAIRSTSSHLHKLLISMDHLLKEDKKLSRTVVADILHEIAEKMNNRALIVVFSDMFDNKNELSEIFKALQHLKHNKHEVIIFHVNDRATEHNFQFDDRPYEFIDLESGNRVKLQPSQVKEQYRSKMDEYFKELKFKCGQMKIDFVEADISTDFDDILNAYLVKRARMS